LHDFPALVAFAIRVSNVVGSGTKLQLGCVHPR
jgi:hypothetical protein